MGLNLDLFMDDKIIKITYVQNGKMTSLISKRLYEHEAICVM